jgi:regulator of nonsense transcripts 1
MDEFGMDKKKVDQILKNARVVFSTCSSTMLAYLSQVKFKYLLVDEAAQALEPSLMMPLSHECEVICLIGDHKQLPPLVKNEAIKDELGKSLFERLFNFKCIQKTMLNVQYRMHPDIAAFPSAQFYGNKLENSKSVLNDRKGIVFPGEEKPRSILFIHIERSFEERYGKSKVNYDEADKIKELIEFIDKSKAPKILEREIGVITAYSGQVKILKETLSKYKDLTVNTVDGFQGQEREVIIYSAVRANANRDVGFLSDERRFNVAMTRAKRLLVVVGNRRTLETNQLWKSWIDWMCQNGHVMNH